MHIFPLWRRVKKRPDELAQRVAGLEQEVADLKQCCRELASSACAPVVVEKLCVERISVDRLEFTNNLGALGIRELSGNLNIGANYGVMPGKKGGPPPPGATSPPVPPPGATTAPGQAGGKEARPPGKKAGAPAPPAGKNHPPPSPGVDGSPSAPSGSGKPGPSPAGRQPASSAPFTRAAGKKPPFPFHGSPAPAPSCTCKTGEAVAPSGAAGYSSVPGRKTGLPPAPPSGGETGVPAMRHERQPAVPAEQTAVFQPPLPKPVNIVFKRGDSNKRVPEDTPLGR